jgi:hypothetical protein
VTVASATSFFFESKNPPTPTKAALLRAHSIYWDAHEGD